jgi:hypothetical protein
VENQVSRTIGDVTDEPTTTMLARLRVADHTHTAAYELWIKDNRRGP